MGTGEGLGGEGTSGTVGMGDGEAGKNPRRLLWGGGRPRGPQGSPLVRGGGERILYGENLRVSGGPMRRSKANAGPGIRSSPLNPQAAPPPMGICLLFWKKPLR